MAFTEFDTAHATIWAIRRVGGLRHGALASLPDVHVWQAIPRLVERKADYSRAQAGWALL